MIKKSIASCKLEDFQKKIDFLNKKLRKMGKPELSFQVCGSYVALVDFRYHEVGDAFRNDRIERRNIEFLDIEVEGLEFFKKDDCEYVYIGSINYEKGIKTVYCIDDEKYLKYFQTDSDFCDHCHTKRRRNSYVLFEGEGKVIRVGSSCCRDFFGYDVSGSINCYLQTIFLFGGEPDWDSYKESETYDFHLIYKLVRHCTNDFTSWKKSEYSEDTGSCLPGTTADIRYEIDNMTKDSEFLKHPVPEGAFDKISEYWNSQEEDSTFNMNMKEALKRNYCIPKNIGSYAYAIFAAINHERRIAAQELLKKTMKDCPFKDGDRPEVTGTVTHVRSYEDSYNYYDITYTYCIEFLSDDNVFYYLSTSAAGFWNVMVNDKITVKGTVSGRKDYREKKRWQLKRPMLIKHEQINKCNKDDKN